MAWLLKKIHTGSDTDPQRDEQPAFTNFIR